MATGGSSRRVPGWIWVVVPMTVSALLFGALAVAVRTSGDDDGAASISGPAAGLPAVTDAVETLLDTVPGDADVPAALGTRYGEATVAFAELPDPVDYAAEFERLPDAEARALGRTLGAMQTELSPTESGGARTGDDRAGDILFALGLSRAAVVAMDPTGPSRDQALAILPFSIQDLTGFDALADEFIHGDLALVATRVDAALTTAGASELISSVANAISDRLQADPDDAALAAAFLEGYDAGTI